MGFRCLTVSALMLLLPVASVAAAVPDATPASALACTLEPRPSSDVMKLLYDPAGTPVDMPPPLRITNESNFPSGEEVDTNTIEAINATAQEFAACSNTGEFLRYSALYTDELLLQQGLQAYWSRDEIAAQLVTRQDPDAPGSELAVGPARSARVLADGRIGAAFTFERGGTSRNAFLVFEQQDGQWRLDEIHPSVLMNMVAPVWGYRVVAEYPHDPDAFTQGLDIADGKLYEGTGLRGESTLRRVELESGEVLQLRELDEEYFGEGITVLNARIYQLTWQSGICFVYDAETFELLQTFQYEGQGWGLTSDGERLIMSNGTDALVYRDPETFAEIGRVDVRDDGIPISNLNELEYIDGEVWANVWQTDRIARIDPADGRVVGWIDLSGLLSQEDRQAYDVDVLNGIAYDAESGRIFVTGKLWPKLFEIELTPPE